MKLSLIAVICFLVFFSISAAATTDIAATLTVTKIADTNDGVCDSDCSLREAVIVANSGDTIVFSPLFNQPQTILLTNGQISINKSLAIAGPNADLLAVSENNASGIFNISNNAVVTLTGMRLKDSREAIALTYATLTLTNMTLSNNQDVIRSRVGIVNIINSNISNNSGNGVRGDGLKSDSHILINVVNSTFNGNSGRAITGSTGRIFVINSIITNNREGGISNDDSQAILTIDRTLISNNESLTFAGTVGGGVLNRGTATISNTTINNNHVSGRGGGIFNIGTMSITDSTISNNSALMSAGGIFNAIGQLHLTNSTVSGNVADFGGGFGSSPGGGIYNLANDVNRGGSVFLTNSTITNNRASGSGGGLRQDALGTATIRNTIIAGNLSSTSEKDVSSIIVSQGFNLIGDSSGSSGWTASDLLNRNPLLAPLGNNGGPTLTHALMPGSPAINAGSNDLARNPTTNRMLSGDQRDFARFIGGMGGIVDIGSYESNVSDSPIRLNGRVLTSDGRGISNVRITLTDANGTIVYAQTNPFGYYRFVNLPPGTTYTVRITHKRYKFDSPQTVTLDGNRSDLNFIASL